MSNLSHTFVLFYPVCDSADEFIMDKNNVIMEFGTVNEAIEFREKDDVSQVSEENYFWISDTVNGKSVPTLKHCGIQLYEPHLVF